MQLNDHEEVSTCTECQGCKKTDSLFCDLSVQELDIFSEKKADNFYKKGEVIFQEGSRGRGIYCVYKGKVKVYKIGDEAKERIVRFVKDGDVLGYRSLLSDEPYCATATVIEDSIICYVPKSKFMEVLKNNQNLAYKTIQMLSKDLKESERKIVHLHQKPVIERIAEALLILKEKFGISNETNTLDVVLTRREIGDLAGVTTETTIRTLSFLNKEGVLNLNGKRIELANLSQLVRLANLMD
ncbi:MAG: Crp/Fnr family transcriptional regulator [Flavobacteriales bacterium]|nr:Crp/Fnr family transcriptional regulator [Flavobacteriales bacterium]MBT5133394.1 Crp/Fnr family transcriptional regulator [Flavobacteriales bacterium]